jgi:hypothetical protein
MVGAVLAFNYELFDREKIAETKLKQYLCPVESWVVSVDLALLINPNIGQHIRLCPYF